MRACMFVHSEKEKRKEEEKQGKEMQAKRRKVTFNCDLDSFSKLH